MRRTGCLHVPQLPLAAILRTDPERSAGLVVEEGRGRSATVRFLDERARALGVRRGMRTFEARSRCPGLVVRGRDPELERRTREALVELSRDFSPRIQDSGPGIVHLDLGRTGGPAAEIAIGQAMLRAALRSANLRVRVGFSDTRFVSTLAADVARDLEIVPPGGEEAFLASLEIDRLDLDGELRDRLGRWGITSLGDLSRLPRLGLGERLGPAAFRLQDLARGREPGPLVPTRSPEQLEEAVDLDWVLPSIEPLLFLVRASIDRLRTQLSRGGRACRRLELELHLEDGERHRNRIDLRSPSRDTKVLWTLLRLELEKRPPRAPIAGLRLRMVSSEAAETQLPLFGYPTPRLDRLEAILARLLSLLGKDTRLGILEPRDAHRPEAFSVLPFDASLTVSESPVALGPAVLGLRRFTPAISCRTTSLDTGRPRRAVRDPTLPPRPDPRPPGRIRPDPGAPDPLEGGVGEASGPWVLLGEWWGQSALDREYWDVELLAGTVLRLAVHGADASRRIDGLYD